MFRDNPISCVGRAIWMSPQHFLDDINEYIRSCQYHFYEKARVDGNDEFVHVTDLNNEEMHRWQKIPSVEEFCRLKGIYKKAYYEQKKRGYDYEEVMEYFSDTIISAAKALLTDSGKYKGAAHILALKKVTVEKEEIALEREKVALEKDNVTLEKEKLALDAARLNNEIMKARLNEITDKYKETPYINSYLVDLKDVYNENVRNQNNKETENNE